MALDLKTGAIRWVTRGDAASTPGRSTASRSSATATYCPEPAGPDYDFGQAPALFTVKDGNGKPR